MLLHKVLASAARTIGGPRTKSTSLLKRIGFRLSSKSGKVAKNRSVCCKCLLCFLFCSKSFCWYHLRNKESFISFYSVSVYLTLFTEDNYITFPNLLLLIELKYKPQCSKLLFCSVKKRTSAHLKIYNVIAQVQVKR